MKLVDDWQDWPRWVSAWCEAAAAAFFSALLIAPDAALQVWAILPADIRAAIPADWLKWGGVALIVVGSLAKIVDQPRLRRRRDATAWLWTYNNERPNMALGGITPKQKLASKYLTDSTAAYC